MIGLVLAAGAIALISTGLYLLIKYARADAAKEVVTDADEAAIDVLTELGRREIARDNAELERRRLRRRRSRGGDA